MPPHDEWFGPDGLARYRNVWLAFLAVVVAAPLSAIAAFARPLAGAVVAVAALVLALLVARYNRAFERSVEYRLAPDEVQYRRGVWIRKRSEVPYRRISNVETTQGPLQRRVGIGTVAVQTPGQSGQTGPELSVSGVADYEEIKAEIVARARDQDEDSDGTAGESRSRPLGASAVPSPGADDSTREAGTDGDDLLAEVRRIRELLESER